MFPFLIVLCDILYKIYICDILYKIRLSIVKTSNEFNNILEGFPNTLGDVVLSSGYNQVGRVV